MGSRCSRGSLWKSHVGIIRYLYVRSRGERYQHRFCCAIIISTIVHDNIIPSGGFALHILRYPTQSVVPRQAVPRCVFQAITRYGFGSYARCGFGSCGACYDGGSNGISWCSSRQELLSQTPRTDIQKLPVSPDGKYRGLGI